MDAFQLASPSDEDSGSDEPASSDSDGEWIMADGADAAANGQSELSDSGSDDYLEIESPSEEDDNIVKASSKASSARIQSGKKRGRSIKGEAIFAPAEDYAHLIEDDKPVRRPKKKSRK